MSGTWKTMGRLIPPYVVSSDVDTTLAKLEQHAMRGFKSYNSPERTVSSLKSGQTLRKECFSSPGRTISSLEADRFYFEGMLPSATSLRVPKTKKKFCLSECVTYPSTPRPISAWSSVISPAVSRLMAQSHINPCWRSSALAL